MYKKSCECLLKSSIFSIRKIKKLILQPSLSFSFAILVLYNFQNYTILGQGIPAHFQNPKKAILSMYCEQFLPFNFRTYSQQDAFYKTERGGGSGSSEVLKQACLSEVYGRKPEDSHVELTFPRKMHISGSTI